MTPDFTPHICGGTLFDLLLQSKKARRKARDKFNGGSDGLTAPAIYAGLIFIVTGEDLSSYAGTTLERCASDYKKCVSSSGEYVPFTDPGTKSAFDAAYKRKDPAILERTTGFINKYLNLSKCEWLTRALIETMQAEDDLQNVEIAINGNETKAVRELHTVGTVVFPIFLLSVIHFVMVNRPECETGRATFERWYSQTGPKAEWKFMNHELGNSIPALSLTFDIPVTAEQPPQQPMPSQVQNLGEKNDHEVIEDQIRKVGTAAAATLADALSRMELPTEEQILKSGQALANALGAFEHQTAERIRASQNKSDEEPETDAEEIVEDQPHIDSDSKVVNYIQNQTNIAKQEINNFDLENASGITFNL